MLCVATAMVSPAQTFTSLASFDGGNGGDPQYMSLVQGPDGSLYGTTTYGGVISCEPKLGCGVVFKVTTEGKLTVTHRFEYTQSVEEGIRPFAGLLLAPDGNFYGTTTNGGQDVAGTVFKITQGGTVTTLYSFCPQGLPCTSGGSPYGGLVQTSDGNFYGTTAWGGTNTACYLNCGTVFKITSAGALTTLANFCVDTPCNFYSADPYGALVLGTDGNFYGTTYYGGGENCNGAYPTCGTVFKVTPGGTLTTLHSFEGNDGGNPAGGLVQGADGNFYGTTSAFGANGGGTLFKITSGGTLTTLYNFCSPPGCAGGGSPFGTLLQATDGNFYGTTYGSVETCNPEGTCGTIFQITPGGTLTTLFQLDNTDGGYPRGGLVQATNGILYGTTSAGGDLSCAASGCGTVFSLDMGLGPFVAFVRNPAKVGQAFGILGQGFTGTTSVSLNGIPAGFTIVSDTLIRATVPAGATTGYVTVTTPSGALTSNVPFHVIK